jgi:NhaP-type Na+/H+ or K+/H+ antiporter
VSTRETGVVATAIAGILVALEVPDADVAVTVVALAVVVTLALQTTTKPWLARRLGLLEPADEALEPEILGPGVRRV